MNNINEYKDDKGGWRTLDEIKFIDYMASDEPRGRSNKCININEKIQRLQSWLLTSLIRFSPVGVDMARCYSHAIEVLNKLIAKA